MDCDLVEVPDGWWCRRPGCDPERQRLLPVKARRNCKAAVARVHTAKGPGTELKRLLKRLGIKKGRGCSCQAFARKMNLWGVDGCEERMDEIIEHLRGQATKRGLPFIERVARLLVRWAIRNARRKATHG